MPKTIHIELYPSDQSCALQCAGCGFGDTGKVLTNTLDPRVGETFNLIQNELVVLNQHPFTINYNLPRNASITEELPSVDNLHLLDELSIGLGTIAGNKDYAKTLIKKLDQLLQGFTGTNNTLKLIFRRGGNNYTQEQRKHIFTILSHSIQKDKRSPKGVGIDMERNLANETFDLHQYHDTINLEKQFLTLREKIKLTLDNEFIGGHRYPKKVNKQGKDYRKELYNIPNLCSIYKSYTRVKTPETGRHIRINERIVQKLQKSTINDYFHRAIQEIQGKERADEVGISIFPRGVHLFHSSIDIDNPFFRCSHEVFKDMVMQYGIEAPWMIVEQNLQSLTNNLQ